MIISVGRRYIFVHIPKTGGTSLAMALENRAKKDDVMLGDTPKALRRRRRLKDVKSRGRLWKHSTMSDIEGLIDRQKLQQLYAFTLVRNPWDRLVSYYHWLRMQNFEHAHVTLANKFGFQGFARQPRILEAFEKNPASVYMRHSDGQEQCNAYIRIEHFSQDAQELFDHLGFSIELTRENETLRERDYRTYYNGKTRDVVAKACAEDIERFGYTFD